MSKANTAAQAHAAWLPRHAVVDGVAYAVLAACAVAAFGPAFGGWPGYFAAGASALAGLILAVLATWRRWAPPLIALLVLIVYFLIVGPLALPDTVRWGVLPSLETLQRGSLLIIQSWRDLLTVGIPANSISGPAVVPVLTGLVATTTGVILALSRRYLWGLMPMAAFMLIGLLWGTSSPTFGGWLGALPGAVFAITALGWGYYRQTLVAETTEADVALIGETTRTPPSRYAATFGVLALASALALGLAPAIASGQPRFALRNVVQPPLNLRAYASPLMSYHYLENDQREETLFSVTGLPKDARVRLATMDTYDGIVFQVADSSAGYRLVGSEIQARSPRPGTPVTVSYRIDGYSGVWLPGGGDLRGVAFTGSGSADQARTLYYNADTGTALVTAGVAQGTAYRTELVLPSTYTDEQLAQWGPNNVALPPPSRVPEVIGKFATEYTDGAQTPIEQLRAIEKQLRAGFYSSGDGGEVLSGHSAYRITTMFATPEQLVGDDEQYAVTMALMARQLGFAARVVMGFYPSEEAPATWPVTGNDAHVWVEVAFNQAGWVTFDPTPDRDRRPQTTVPKPQPRPKPQVQPPPIPPKEPVQPPADLPGDKSPAKQDEPVERDWVRYLVWGAAGAVGLVVLLSPLMVVAALRARRRRRRRNAALPADSMTGGWAEVVDAATDLGIPLDLRRTRQELADTIDDQVPTAQASELAVAVDAGVFGPSAAGSDEVAAVWRSTQATISAMRHGVSRRRRVAALMAVTSLRYPAPTAPVALGHAPRRGRDQRIQARRVKGAS